MTEEWLDFITRCRLGIPYDYDIVEGLMANDTIFNYVQDFVDDFLLTNKDICDINIKSQLRKG